MEDLYLFGKIEDKLIIKICKKQKIALPEQMVKDYEVGNVGNVSNPKGQGFLTALAYTSAIVDEVDALKKHRRNGHCDSNKAHSPSDHEDRLLTLFWLGLHL